MKFFNIQTKHLAEKQSQVIPTKVGIQKIFQEIISVISALLFVLYGSLPKEKNQVVVEQPVSVDSKIISTASKAREVNKL
jgi:hypothetical protein